MRKASDLRFYRKTLVASAAVAELVLLARATGAGRVAGDLVGVGLDLLLHVALGLRGTVPGPTQTWLMVDADSLFSTLPGSINDYPDAGDNHGADGHNALFADGHSEWVAVKGNRYLLLRELSQDDGKSTP